jgi:hypothetical protein
MGKLLKNPDIAPGTLGVRLPLGASALSDVPVDGVIRFNQTNNKVEFYYNSTWNQIAKIGTVQLVVDSFTGNGSNYNFTMSQIETDATAVAVFIGGVYQQPTTNYTVSSYTISFTSPPPAPGINPNQIVIIHNINSTNAV